MRLDDGHIELKKRIVVVLLASVIVLPWGCGRDATVASLRYTIPKPSGREVQSFSVAATDGFSKEERAQYNIGAETTWVGFSKPFTLDYPPSLATPAADQSGFSSGYFTTTSGARVGFLVLEPVDRELDGFNPKESLAKQKKDLLNRCEREIPNDVKVANGWVGEPMEDELHLRGRVHLRLLFFSEREFLQVSFRWQEGSAQQEQEAMEVLAYGLWSLKVSS